MIFKKEVKTTKVVEHEINVIFYEERHIRLKKDVETESNWIRLDFDNRQVIKVSLNRAYPFSSEKNATIAMWEMDNVDIEIWGERYLVSLGEVNKERDDVLYLTDEQSFMNALIKAHARIDDALKEVVK